MSSGSQKTETRTTPWGPQADQLRTFYQQAGERYDVPIEQFSGQRTAGFGSDQGLAFQMTRDLATDFAPRDAANQFIGDVLGGEFMGAQGSNPLLDQQFDVMSKRIGQAYQRNVLPGIQSRFAGAGQSASPQMQAGIGRSEETLARELGDLGTQIYYGDYERRMGDRFKAVGAQAGLQQQEQAAIGALGATGAMQQGLEQQLINEAIERFNFGQIEPEQRLDRFGQRVGQNLGFGTTTGTAPGGNTGLSVGLGLMGLMGTLGGAALMGPAAGVAGGGLMGSTAGGGLGALGNFLA